MKHKNQNRLGLSLRMAALPSAILGVILAAPAPALGQGAMLEEIIVSARRQQESSQEVPISITVFNQEQLDNANVVSGAELATYTPSLATNNRFGPDQASFAIRGFTQELRTTASVGFYFAEVVAPRGGGSVTSGDGAGPGAFFDLQDVLVLKGPQGTLFGRNTTGGAIMITPQEPTNELEGYLEASAGNYDMTRLQGVINIPFSDKVRGRFGVDTMERDGYLKNGGVGPSRLGDTDYISARASLIVDITDDIQNYTIASYTDSSNNGIVSGLFACNPAGGLFTGPRAGGGSACADQLARQGDDFYAVESPFADPRSELEQWQVINTTTWQATDDLTVKNIISYADMEQHNNTGVYGLNYAYGNSGVYYGFTESNSTPGYATNSQTSFVEELQFQGYAFDGRMTWQAGLYYENSKPDGWSSSQSVNQLACSFVDPLSPENSVCADPIMPILAAAGQAAAFPNGYGAISRQFGKIEYTSRAAYTEVTYEVTDDFRVTGGLRYTHDKSEGEAQFHTVSGFPLNGSFGSGSLSCGDPASAPSCEYDADQTSEAFTGLINFDYFLTQDVMLYAKYSRGYRQGSVSMFGGPEFRAFDPEFVNAYEVGAKTKFGGVVPGTFNVALFYNDLKDQQLQYGYLKPGVTPTQLITNAGSSVIQGMEVEASLRLLDNLRFNLSYTHLDTELKEATVPVVPGVNIQESNTVGGDLTFSPRHSVVAGLNYLLPVPVELGDISLGATYIYTDEQVSTSIKSSPWGKLPSYELVNFNLSWNSIVGSNFDASLFVTNAFDEEYPTYVSGLYNSLGFETRMHGMPRMWGARLRYTFGQ
jgi:iron complex outermembrane receptor protein